MGILKFMVSFGEGWTADLVNYSSFCCRLRTFVFENEAHFDVTANAIDQDREKTDELGYSVQLNVKQLTGLTSAMLLKPFRR